MRHFQEKVVHVLLLVVRFGCRAYALVHKDNRQKLDSHSIKCIFLGYDAKCKKFQLMKKGSKQIIISRYVVCDEIWYIRLNILIWFNL
jgi:hypothetical protein